MTCKATLLFICSVCQAPVYRTGKHVKIDSKLCGKHGKVSDIVLPASQAGLTKKEEKKDLTVESQNGILTTIEKLNRVRERALLGLELAQRPEHKDKDFLTIWKMTE